MNPPELAVVILAAGKGTRLEPITFRHSKAMTPILGTPILARIIESFRKAGMNDFIVVKGPGDPELDKLCAKLREEGVAIKTAVQKKRLGADTDSHIQQLFDISPEWVERARSAIPENMAMERELGFVRKASTRPGVDR